jgi:hypothetical protein
LDSLPPAKQQESSKKLSAYWQAMTITHVHM